MRTPRGLSGPWSTLKTLFDPPENNRKNVMIYAGKAHPQFERAGLVQLHGEPPAHLAPVRVSGRLDALRGHLGAIRNLEVLCEALVRPAGPPPILKGRLR